MRWLRRTGISRRNCVSAWVDVVRGLRMVCIGFFGWWDHVCKVLRFYLKRNQRYKSANTFRDLRVSEILWTDVTRWEKGESCFQAFQGHLTVQFWFCWQARAVTLTLRGHCRFWQRPLMTSRSYDDVIIENFWKSPNFISSDRKRFVSIL